MLAMFRPNESEWAIDKYLGRKRTRAAASNAMYGKERNDGYWSRRAEIV